MLWGLLRHSLEFFVHLLLAWELSNEHFALPNLAVAVANLAHSRLELPVDGCAAAQLLLEGKLGRGVFRMGDVAIISLFIREDWLPTAFELGCWLLIGLSLFDFMHTVGLTEPLVQAGHAVLVVLTGEILFWLIIDRMWIGTVPPDSIAHAFTATTVVLLLVPVYRRLPSPFAVQPFMLYREDYKRRLIFPTVVEAHVPSFILIKRYIQLFYTLFAFFLLHTIYCFSLIIPFTIN